MIISLYRKIITPFSTIGELSFSTNSCFTLEPPMPGLASRPVHRIEAGSYSIELRDTDEGERYRAILDGRYEGMLMLRPNGRDGDASAKIAIGNFPSDTDADILVGLSQEKDAIYESEEAYRLLYSVIVDSIRRGDEAILDVRDGG